MTEPIIARALILVAEYLVGRGNLFELFISAIIFVHVRVILTGKAPVCFLNIVGRSATRHAQNFIEITWHRRLYYFLTRTRTDILYFLPKDYIQLVFEL